MSKKPKYITIKNYLKFTPSEFIHSFVSDIDIAIKTGKNVDMTTYKTSTDKCLPCLGAIACMNFGITPGKIFKMKNPVYKNTAFLGDKIRAGESFTFIMYLDDLYKITSEKQIEIQTRLYKKELHRFIGFLNEHDLINLKKQVLKYVEVLESIGL